jgi:hypothetical protein
MRQNFTSSDSSVGLAVIWDSESTRERLEHELKVPKVNEWCALTHERVIGSCCFDQNTITSRSIQDILEDTAKEGICWMTSKHG